MIRFLLFALVATPALADPAVVEAVDIEATGTGSRISVTLSHPDTGWDHYADGWDVVDAAGKVLASRPLAHPHETEQPFTRSVTAVLPEGIETIYIRTRCNVHGWHPEQFAVSLR